MNRPQFFHATPEGYQDIPFVRPVVLGQDLGGTLVDGEILNDFIIQLDNDAPQIFWSLFIEGVQQDQAAEIHMRLRDAFGNFLTDGYVPLWLYAWGAGSETPDGGSGRAKVFEPEIYCPPGSVLIADFLSSGGTVGLPTYGSPVRMSLIHTAIQMETYPVGGSGQGAPVFEYGGALYQVMQFTGLVGGFPGGIGSVNVYRSTNNGASWSIIDGAHSPSNGHIHADPSAGVYFDGAHTLTVVTSAGTAVDAFAAPVSVRDFDLSTGLWSAAYGAGSSNCYGVNQCFKRSDGSLLVIVIDTLGAGHIAAFVLAGGVWSSFSLTTLFPGGWNSNDLSSAVIDPATDTIHMFGIAFDGVPVKHQYYQQILLSNSVVGFQDLTAVYKAASAMGSPIIVGNQICWGVTDVAITYATILVGSPLSAPVFAIAPSPGILPTQPIPGYPNTLQPTLTTDGVRIWATFCGDGVSDLIYVSFTSNLSNPMLGWDGGLVYDDPTQSIILFPQYLTLSVIPSISEAPVLTVQGNSFGQPTNFFLLPAGALAPSTFPPYMEFRGVKRFPLECSQ